MIKQYKCEACEECEKVCPWGGPFKYTSQASFNLKEYISFTWGRCDTMYHKKPECLCMLHHLPQDLCPNWHPFKCNDWDELGKKQEECK